jgi:threonine dehydratase
MLAAEEIRAARERLAGLALRTPLVPLAGADVAWCKLENLQPIGSFKIRGAGNRMLTADRDRLRDGVYTASAGNMAQGVAWCAREMGVRASVVLPDSPPATKRRAIEELGAELLPVPYDRWWRALVERRYVGDDGREPGGVFVHPVSDPEVMAGNGTIGLEILEDLPDVDTVLVPWGGGGLACGIAAALRELRPSARVVACEVETAAPLTASFAAGRPVTVDRRPSFVDGIGGSGVLAEMWPPAQELIADTVVVSVAQIAQAIRHLALRQRVIAEGAGAAPVAAVLAGAGEGRTVCVVSGGNLDEAVLRVILAGEVPG